MRMSKSTKEQKKVQDFPLPLAAKCLYGQQKENLGLRGSARRSPRSLLLAMSATQM